MRSNKNLIPPRTLAEFRLKRTKRIWIQWLSIATLLAAACFVLASVEAHDLKKRIAAETSAATGPRETHREFQRLSDELRSLSSYQARQEYLRSSYSPLGLLTLLSEIKGALDGKMEVGSLQLRLNPVPVRDNDTTGINDRQSGQVMLEFITRGASNSSQLLQLLRESNFFRVVKLSSALERATPNSDDFRFTVQCEL